MRIANNEIWSNFDGVCEAIDHIVQARTSPHLSAEVNSQIHNMFSELLK